MERDEINQKAQELLGEDIENNALPAFSRTANKLAQISGADDQNLSELSAIILNDPGMTARVLRASNSAYRVRRGKTNSVSRAVVMLGVDEVKRICLGSALVEGIMSEKTTDKLLEEMARAFHAATQARMITVQKGERNSEEIFIAALLKSLGPLMYWGGMGGESDETLGELDSEDRAPDKVEKEVLGVELTDLSEYIADKWKITSLLPTEVDKDPLRRERATRVALCTRLARRSHLGVDSPEVLSVCSEIENATGLEASEMNNVFATSAQEAASAAHFFGAPRVAEMLAKRSALLSGRTEAEVLAEIEARETEFNEAEEKSQDDSVLESETEESQESDLVDSDDDGMWAGIDEKTTDIKNAPRTEVSEFNPTVQLNTLREISSLMLSGADPSNVLGKVLYGMQKGIGLDRVLFAVVDKETNVLTGKIALGASESSWHERCHFVIEEGDFLWQVGQSPAPQWVKEDALSGVPHAMQVVFGRGEFLIAPVIANGTMIAAFYGDQRASQRELSEEICAVFGQFALQGTFALLNTGKK